MQPSIFPTGLRVFSCQVLEYAFSSAPFYFYYCIPRKIRRGVLPKTMCTRIFLSRPSWRLALQFSQRVFSSGVTWLWGHVRPLFHSAQASERPVYLFGTLSSTCSLRTGRIVSRDFFTCPVSEPRDCFTPELLCCSPTPLQQLLPVGTLLPSFPTREYLDLTHCDCPLSLEQNRTFLLTVFSTYTIEEIWQVAHGVQQRWCPLYQWQRNTVQSRMECMCHSQLFRRYQCVQEHPCLYALTTLSLLFLDTNGAKPAPTSRTAIRTTTLFSRQLTFTPSNDPFPGFFQLS